MRGVELKQAYGDITYATAAEVSRNFGRWQDHALAGPVVVTHHGRPRVVVVSAQHYDAMTGADGAAVDGVAGADRLQELLAALAAYQSASAGGGTIRLSRRGVVTAIDDPVARALGLTVEGAVGAPLTELVNPSDRRRLTAALETCFEAGEPGRLELGLLGGGAAPVAVCLGLAPVLKDGTVDGVMVAVTRAAPTDGVEIW